MHNFLILFSAVLIALGLPNVSLGWNYLSKARALIVEISQEPELETYTTDMRAYLRTYYQIRQGKPYYQSLAESVVGDATRDNLPGEIWGWKSPVIFYAWALLPGPAGLSVYIAFLLFLLATLFAIYKLAKKFVGRWAILAPYLVFPYFLLPLTEITLFQVEWWALCFFILGLTFLFYQKFLPACLFFSLTIFTRELFVFHLLTLLAASLILRKKIHVLVLSLPIILLVCFYILYHIPNIYRFESFGSMTSWWRTGLIRGWHLVRPTLAFSQVNYLLFFLQPLRLFLVMATLGLGSLLARNRHREQSLLSLASFLAFFFFIFAFGIQTRWQDYWGIYYVPLAIAFSPTVLTLFDHGKT